MANQDGQVRYVITIDDSNVSSEMRNAENTVEKSSSGLKDKAKKGALAIGAGLATAAVGIGIAAVSSANDMDKAMNQFLASTGEGIGATEQYQKVLEGIYTNNYGESFEDIAEKMGLVKQQMGNIPHEQLQRVTEQAYLLQDTFGIEFKESIRGVDAMMKQFGITSDEAYNLLAQGAQSGLNQNDDLADQLAEYSVYYGQMGFSAEEAMNIMQAGVKDGAYQLDLLNDAMKEFSLNTQFTSENAQGVFKELGFDAEKMTQSFANGGEDSRKAFEDLRKALLKIKDPLKRNDMAVQVFGTKFEDVGSSAIEAMLGLSGSIDSTSDKLGEMEEIKYGSIEEMFEGLKRSVQPILIDLGQKLIPILKQLADSLMPVIEQLLPVFSDLLTGLIPPIGELISSLLPIFVELFEMLMPPLLQIIETLMPPLIELLNALIPIISLLLTLLNPVLELFIALLDPIVNLISSAITPLIEYLGQLIEIAIKPVIAYLEVLSNIFSSVFTTIVDYVTGQVNRLIDILKNMIDFIKNVFTGNWTGAWQNIKNIFKDLFVGIIEGVKLPINTLIDMLNGFIGGLNKIQIPDWVPKVGGKGFHIDLIPKLAKGGLAMGETLAMVGDNPNANVDPEVIAPLSKLKSMLGLDIGSGLSGQKIVYNNITVRDNVIDDSNIDSIGYDFMNKLKRDGAY